MTQKKRSARVASAVHTLARRHCACGPHSGCLSNPESGGVQQCARVTFPAHPLSRSHACHRFVTYTSLSYDVVVSFDIAAQGARRPALPYPPPGAPRRRRASRAAFSTAPRRPQAPNRPRFRRSRRPGAPRGGPRQWQRIRKGPFGPKRGKSKSHTCWRPQRRLRRMRGETSAS